MNTGKKRWAWWGAAALAVSAPALAIETSPPATTTAAAKGNALYEQARDLTARAKEEVDRVGGLESKLMGKLHRVNQMEIEMGKLASDKALNPAVKAYGQRLITDHTQAETDLQALAKSEAMNLAAEPADASDHQHMSVMEQLKTQAGTAFDNAFLAAMVNGHQAVINEVATARGVLEDTRFGKLLDKLLPKLKEHRDIAARLAGSASARRPRPLGR